MSLKSRLNSLLSFPTFHESKDGSPFRLVTSVGQRKISESPLRKDLDKEEARCVTSQRKAAKEIILLETRSILAKYYALINFSGLVPITTVLKLLIKLKPKSIQNEANVEGKNPDDKLSNLFEDYLNMDKRVIVYQYQPRIIPLSPQPCSFQVNMERNYKHFTYTGLAFLSSMSSCHEPVTKGPCKMGVTHRKIRNIGARKLTWRRTLRKIQFKKIRRC